MLPILCQTIESFFASLFFAILFGVRRRDLVCTAGAGAVCWFVYAVVTTIVGEIPAYFLSAVATTIYCEIFARLLRTPTIVYLAAGVIPLVPGGGIYRTMLLCIQGTPEHASTLSALQAQWLWASWWFLPCSVFYLTVKKPMKLLKIKSTQTLKDLCAFCLAAMAEMTYV